MENADMRQKFEAWAKMEIGKYPSLYDLPEAFRIGPEDSYFEDAVAFSWAAYQEAYAEGMREGQPKWIPVEEKLPEITSHWGPGDFYGGSDCILAFRAYSRQICTAVFYSSGAWTTTEGSKLLRVTHWQPLPALPLSTEPTPAKEAEKGGAN